jgi:hypothetical protein
VLPVSPNVILEAAAVHRGLVHTDDLVVALHEGIAEVAAFFEHRL